MCALSKYKPNQTKPKPDLVDSKSRGAAPGQSVGRESPTNKYINGLSRRLTFLQKVEIRKGHGKQIIRVRKYNQASKVNFLAKTRLLIRRQHSWRKTVCEPKQLDKLSYTEANHLLYKAAAQGTKDMIRMNTSTGTIARYSRRKNIKQTWHLKPKNRQRSKSVYRDTFKATKKTKI